MTFTPATAEDLDVLFAIDDDAYLEAYVARKGCGTEREKVVRSSWFRESTRSNFKTPRAYRGLSNARYHELHRTGLYIHRLDEGKELTDDNSYVSGRAPGIKRKMVKSEIFRNDVSSVERIRKVYEALENPEWKDFEDFLDWTFESGYRPEYELQRAFPGNPGPKTFVWDLPTVDIEMAPIKITDPLGEVSKLAGTNFTLKFRRESGRIEKSFTEENYRAWVLNQHERGNILPGTRICMINEYLERPFFANNLYFSYRKSPRSHILSGHRTHGFSGTEIYQKYQRFVQNYGEIAFFAYLDKALDAGYKPGYIQHVSRDGEITFTEGEKEALRAIIDAWYQIPEKQNGFKDFDSFVEFSVRARYTKYCSFRKVLDMEIYDESSCVWDIFDAESYEKYAKDTDQEGRHVHIMTCVDPYVRKLYALHHNGPIADVWWKDKKSFKDWCIKNGAVFGERKKILRIDSSLPYSPDNCYVG